MTPGRCSNSKCSVLGAVIAVLLLLCDHTANAIYKDDVGVLDFSVATAGHGSVGWASFRGDLVITSDRPDPRKSGTTSCYVAARGIADGSLAWRTNVCSTSPDAATTQSHSVAASETAVYTVDHRGIARAWTAESGDLLWEARVAGAAAESAAPPGVFFVDVPGLKGLVAVSAGSDLVFLDAATGNTADTVTAPGGGAGDRKHVEWLSVLSPEASSPTLKLAFARVSDGDRVISGSGDFFTGTYAPGGDFKPGAGMHRAKNIVADSVRSFASGGDVHVWAVLASGAVAHSVNGGPADVVPAKDWKDTWSAVVKVEPTADPSVVLLSGIASEGADATMEAFRYDGSSWKPLAAEGAAANSAVAVAPTLGMVLATPLDRSVEVRSADSGGALDLVGDVFGGDGDSVAVVSVSEQTDSAMVLIGTERGTTTLLSLAKSGNGKAALTVRWSAEEGLANLSSAIILDASHLGSDDLVEETNTLAYRLSMGGRLKAQWQEIGTMLSTANGLIGDGGDNRDHLFGFLKVSALLSSKNHRMWGMSSAGADRGSIRWSLDLPKTALWHSMVHGTTNAPKAVHGIHGDTHSREILVLSASPGRVDWMCIDGTSGAINAQDSIPVTATIRQVVPVYGASTGGCRQTSLLLGDDLGLTAVPADAPTAALIQTQLSKTPNGLYTHTIDTVGSKVESFRVSHDAEKGSFAANPVGLATFAGERIVKVAYPKRHEDMQSMSTILGDNSLLLKYINPHMAVVVTVLTDPDDQKATEVATAIAEEGSGKQRRKPAGAGEPGSSTAAQPDTTTTDELPNMFVNLVDTVSGRVLYRHGHVRVDPDKPVSVVVSENWVVYSYSNAKTRRAEVGVLTLHEGMIEPKGLTYFAQPEQSTTFSSFDSRESKPVVLSKVYTFPKAVTALGVTSTRQGIGRQNFLLASADGRINSLNKMVLETRRPVGEAKPQEKKEGLVPYGELIPESPLFSLNYNQTHERFEAIVSAPTALESQSLVFAFGGPDLFFTRTSPTKGFDLLPETFNKSLVGMATVGIVVALLVVQRMGKKKALKRDWS